MRMYLWRNDITKDTRKYFNQETNIWMMSKVYEKKGSVCWHDRCCRTSLVLFVFVQFHFVQFRLDVRHRWLWMCIDDVGFLHEIFTITLGRRGRRPPRFLTLEHLLEFLLCHSSGKTLLPFSPTGSGFHHKLLPFFKTARIKRGLLSLFWWALYWGGSAVHTSIYITGNGAVVMRWGCKYDAVVGMCCVF